MINLGSEGEGGDGGSVDDASEKRDSKTEEKRGKLRTKTGPIRGQRKKKRIMEKEGALNEGR